jgi:hypothetical protein
VFSEVMLRYTVKGSVIFGGLKTIIIPAPFFAKPIIFLAVFNAVDWLIDSDLEVQQVHWLVMGGAMNRMFWEFSG